MNSQRTIRVPFLRGLDSAVGPYATAAFEELEGFALDPFGKLVKMDGLLPINATVLADVDTTRYTTEAACVAAGGVWIPPAIHAPNGACALGVKGLGAWQAIGGRDRASIIEGELTDEWFNTAPEEGNGLCIHPDGSTTGNLTLEEALNHEDGCIDWLQDQFGKPFGGIEMTAPKAAYFNSWNLDSLMCNGVSVLNQYYSKPNWPDPWGSGAGGYTLIDIPFTYTGAGSYNWSYHEGDDYWYFQYVGSWDWSHFELY